MKKEFIPYKLALRMKQLGFDERCLAWYYGRDLWMVDQKESEPINYRKNPIRAGNGILAPTWQSAFAWFRNEHGIPGTVTHFPKYNNNGLMEYIEYRYSIIEDNEVWDEIVRHKTYEEAQQECLEKLCEIVETFKNK